MRLSELLGHEDFRQMLDDMIEPETTRPPQEKGTDAIKVRAYVVHGHWRRRHKALAHAAVVIRRHRRSRALTPSELERAQKL